MKWPSIVYNWQQLCSLGSYVHDKYMNSKKFNTNKISKGTYEIFRHSPSEGGAQKQLGK